MRLISTLKWLTAKYYQRNILHLAYNGHEPFYTKTTFFGIKLQNLFTQLCLWKFPSNSHLLKQRGGNLLNLLQKPVLIDYRNFHALLTS